MIHFETQLTVVRSIKIVLKGAVVQWGALLYESEGSKYTNQGGRFFVEIGYPINVKTNSQ